MKKTNMDSTGILIFVYRTNLIQLTEPQSDFTNNDSTSANDDEFVVCHIKNIILGYLQIGLAERY